MTTRLVEESIKTQKR